MDDLPARVAALEQWRIMAERLNDERHHANLMQFQLIKDGQLATNQHLSRQDDAAIKLNDKLDKVAGGVDTIAQRLAGIDGGTVALDKAAATKAAEDAAARQQTTNYIAIASVIVGAIGVIAGLYWGNHF